MFSGWLWNDRGGIVLQRTCYIPSPFGNLLLKTAIGAERTGKPPLRWSLLLQSSLRRIPGEWDCRQSCKYTLGATFVIISQNFLIARHKSFGRATIARHNIKHVLWRAIAARVAFYSRPGLWWVDLLWRAKSEKKNQYFIWFTSKDMYLWPFSLFFDGQENVL